MFGQSQRAPANLVMVTGHNQSLRGNEGKRRAIDLTGQRLDPRWSAGNFVDNLIA